MSLQKAIKYGREGRFQEALALLSSMPRSSSQSYLLGLCHLNLGDSPRAKQCFELCLSFDSSHPGANLNLANLLISEGLYVGVERLLLAGQRRATGVDALGILIGLAFVSLKTGSDLRARKFSKQALSLNAQTPEVLNVAGLVEEKFGNYLIADRLYQDATALNPSFLAARVNRARLLARSGEREAAVKILEYVVSKRLDQDTCLSCASVYCSLECAHEALNLIDFAELKFGVSWATNVSKFCYFCYFKDWAAASVVFSKLADDHDITQCGHLDVVASFAFSTCDWSLLDATLSKLEDRLSKGDGLDPLHASYLFDDPEKLRVFCENAVRPYKRSPPSHNQLAGTGDLEPLRIGYLSGDLRHHPIGQLTEQLFQYHRDSGVFVAAFYTGPRVSETDKYHRNIKDAVSVWHEVTSYSTHALANLIESYALDLLVDLSGHTSYSRLDVLAVHPARLTATYLGFPGTTGLSNVDFIFADTNVVPHNSQEHFSESEVIYFSPCYQVNSNQRPVPSEFSRESYGLPSDKFVFCSFNGLQKLSREQFLLWASILTSCQESVLWLLCSSASAKSNLQRELAQVGLAPERLIFAENLPLEKHISRLSVADLFLDTFPYTAHTTASDAIWAGLPILTREGFSFQSRVCGSILRGIGHLDDFICDSSEVFIRKATFFYENRAILNETKQYLRAHRANLKLFDARNISDQIEGLLKSRCR